MTHALRRSTIYFEPELHQALKIKSSTIDIPFSHLVNEAVRNMLREDQEDLEAFSQRIAEPTLSYEQLLDDLKRHGKL